MDKFMLFVTIKENFYVTGLLCLLALLGTYKIRGLVFIGPAACEKNKARDIAYRFVFAGLTVRQSSEHATLIPCVLTFIRGAVFVGSVIQKNERIMKLVRVFVCL